MSDQSNSAGELNGVAEATVSEPVEAPVVEPVEAPVEAPTEAPVDHTDWLVNAEHGLRNVLRLVLNRDHVAAKAELDALNTSLKG